MRVGVVTTSYPRFADDHAGNFVGEHVRVLRELGHDVEVIAADDATDELYRGTRHDDAVRVPSEGLFYGGGAPDLLERHPRRYGAALRFSARLALAVARRARRWDSIVAHWLAPSALAALPTRAPLLAIAHGGDIHMLRRARLLAPALYLLRARSAELVFVSEELRAIAIAAAPRLAGWLAASRVQPMGIDLARFRAIERAPTEPPTLLVIARLVPVKGVDVAIAAMRFVTRPARLVIAGSGPDLGKLVHLAYGAPDTPSSHVVVHAKSELAALERERGIGFRFAVDTRERDRLLANASVVVIPSRIVGGSDGERSEGTPLVALEALAAGIPVVASAVGGLRSLRGVELVPPDDPAALARAIDRVLDAPTDRSTLRATVVHLDWRRVGHALVRSP